MIATPIGNLEDITLRAIRVLKEVDIIASEDTRTTLKLLNHYDIAKKQISLHAHNEKRMAKKIITYLEDGKKIALVSEGGTPCISDPGSHITRSARDKGFRVVPIPGPSAISAILSVAGSKVKGVSFWGFLSSKKGKRKKKLSELLQRNEGFILFESPYRIIKLLEQLAELAPQRELLVGREMTKIYEEFLYGIPNNVLTQLKRKTKIKGEFTIFIREQ